jgi:hypothetical protein
MKPTHRMLFATVLALAAGLPACTPHHGGGPGEPPPCEQRRIRKIYAIPGTLLLIQSTNIEVETFDDAVEGETKVAFMIRQDGGSEAQATLAPAAQCESGSAACYTVTCVGVGASTEIDEDTGFVSADVRVAVTVDDDECRDESEIWIQCLAPSDEQTCNTCIENIDIAEAAALGSACLGPLLLRGEADHLEAGCLDDDACAALWSCQQHQLCHVPNAAACFCGELGDESACAEPGFTPSGDCEAEERAAFEAQLTRAADSNAELLSKMFDMLDAPSGFPSLAAAHSLSSACLVPDGTSAAPKTRALLQASGLHAEAIERCIDACFR